MASSAANGSSISSTACSGPPPTRRVAASARASATRCRIPPDSSCGRLPPASVSRTSSSSSAAFSRRSARPKPASRSGSSTLRAAVSHGISAASWNMTAGRDVFSVIFPADGASSPATRFSSVLLPQPDAPSRQTNSPGATVRSTPSSATTARPAGPNVLRTPSSRTAVAPVKLLRPVGRVVVIAGCLSGSLGEFGSVHGGLVLLLEDLVQRTEVGEALQRYRRLDHARRHRVLRELRELGRDRVGGQLDAGERAVDDALAEAAAGQLLEGPVDGGLRVRRVGLRPVDRGQLALQDGLDGVRVLLQELAAHDDDGGREATARPQALLVDED